MVRPKKSLGQHFLTDRNIAAKIVAALPSEPATLVEIGPGTGMLTELILQRGAHEAIFIETDSEAVHHLHERFPHAAAQIIHADFLKFDLRKIPSSSYQIAGNLPYNISGPVFFRILEDRNRIASAVVMIQKEVADRIRSAPGTKVYGILSVLLQTWFDIEYLFTVSPHVFYPPPKVTSAVISLRRNHITGIGCSEAFYIKLVKTAFNQRRKTLRNALKALLSGKDTGAVDDLLSKRAEQLGTADFIVLAKFIESS